MRENDRLSVDRALAERFADAPDADAAVEAADLIATMASRGSCRQFKSAPVPRAVLEMLCAVALSAPTKSDLQQRDIVVLDEPDQIAALAGLVEEQAWVAKAPAVAVFCGNNRRQRLVHDQLEIPFANDHLDAFFNAAVDAGIALATFVTAAEAQGLGCCPISAVRNQAQAVSDMLALPDHVFPVAGLAIGHPAAAPKISMRLPLGVTCHWGTFSEPDLPAALEEYSEQRAKKQPYAAQRLTGRFGKAQTYGWAEDKARQYSVPERADFGAFIRRKGFLMD